MNKNVEIPAANKRFHSSGGQSRPTSLGIDAKNPKNVVKTSNFFIFVP